jgi:hypothetical protein
LDEGLDGNRDKDKDNDSDDLVIVISEDEEKEDSNKKRTWRILSITIKNFNIPVR